MTLSRAQIMIEALKLDPHEREAMAEDLLLSVSADDRGRIDELWLAEAKRRDAEFGAGRMTAKPVDESSVG